MAAVRQLLLAAPALRTLHADVAASPLFARRFIADVLAARRPDDRLRCRCLVLRAKMPIDQHLLPIQNTLVADFLETLVPHITRTCRRCPCCPSRCRRRCCRSW